jgi:hypothetical protein
VLDVLPGALLAAAARLRAVAALLGPVTTAPVGQPVLDAALDRYAARADAGQQALADAALLLAQALTEGGRAYGDLEQLLVPEAVR